MIGKILTLMKDREYLKAIEQCGTGAKGIGELDILLIKGECLFILGSLIDSPKNKSDDTLKQHVEKIYYESLYWYYHHKIKNSKAITENDRKVATLWLTNMSVAYSVNPRKATKPDDGKIPGKSLYDYLAESGIDNATLSSLLNCKNVPEEIHARLKESCGPKYFDTVIKIFIMIFGKYNKNDINDNDVERYDDNLSDVLLHKFIDIDECAENTISGFLETTLCEHGKWNEISKDVSAYGCFVVGEILCRLEYYNDTVAFLYKAKQTETDDKAKFIYLLSLADAYNFAGYSEVALELLDKEAGKLSRNNKNKLQVSEKYIKIKYDAIKYKTLPTSYKNDKTIEGHLDNATKKATKKSARDKNLHERLYYAGRLVREYGLRLTDLEECRVHFVKAEGYFEGAISDLLKKPDSIPKKECKARYHHAFGRLYENLREISTIESQAAETYNKNALNQYEKAKELYKDLKYPVYESLIDNLIHRVKEPPDEPYSPLLNEIISKTIDIEMKVEKSKTVKKQFLQETHRLCAESVPELFVMQRWNSYTPVLSDTHAPSKGGGYYINTGRRGIVVDPGFDFIYNFIQEGFSLNDIDSIFISHAHNDHHADLESILSLLNEYNESEIKGNMYSEHLPNSIYQKLMRAYKDIPEAKLKKKVEDAFAISHRRKIIKIYISAGMFRKCGFLHSKKNNDYDIHILDRKHSSLVYVKEGGRLCVLPFQAKHYDLVSDNDCLGFAFLDIKEKTALIYTGDTGFDNSVEKTYRKLIWDIERIFIKFYKGKTKETAYFLLAHLGGFKPHERSIVDVSALESKKVRQKAYYPHHLGRLGMVSLIEALLNNDKVGSHLKLCIVSEFGEEFKGENCRIKFIEVLKRVFDDDKKVNAKKYVNIDIPTFVAADIGFRLRLSNKDATVLVLKSDVTKHFETFNDYDTLNKICEAVPYKNVFPYEDTGPEGAICYLNSKSGLNDSGLTALLTRVDLLRDKKKLRQNYRMKLNSDTLDTEENPYLSGAKPPGGMRSVGPQ